MRNYFVLVSIGMAITACGGGSGSSTATPTGESPYLTYMKTAFSQTLGEESENAENRFVTDQISGAPVPELAAVNDTASNFEGFSETNVQIAGVDEASALKFDGTDLLALSKSQTNPSVVHFSRDMLQGVASEDPSLHFTPDPNFNYQGLLKNEAHVALVGYENYWSPHRFWLDAVRKKGE